MIVTPHRAQETHGRSQSGWLGRYLDLGSGPGGGRRVQGAEGGEMLNHRVQEELKSRKAVRVKGKVGQRERVLHSRYGICRDHYQFGVI